MKITLNTTKKFVLIPEVSKELNELTVLAVTDFPSKKTVKARIKDAGDITLWEGAEYDAIGQWTDTDVINRISELYNN